MNRTQYEKIHGTRAKPKCDNCAFRKEQAARLRMARHKERRRTHDARQAAVASGKLIILFELDEFTGHHYRADVYKRAMSFPLFPGEYEE